jgi:hypothetical protein
MKISNNFVDIILNIKSKQIIEYDRLKLLFNYKL